jgi:hypothetical protein
LVSVFPREKHSINLECKVNVFLFVLTSEIVLREALPH